MGGELAWYWLDIGIVLVWRRRGIGMVLVWAWYLVWHCYGIGGWVGMVTVWYWYGIVIVLGCYQYSIGVVLV